MKIAYWGNFRQDKVQSQHMAAISIMLTIYNRKRVILLENSHEQESLERVFRGIERFYYVREDTDYFMHENGMDLILKEIHYTHDLEPLLSSSAVEVIKDYLYYVPQSRVTNHLVYEYELNQHVADIMEEYNKMYDFTIVKTSSSNTLSFKTIIEIADLVIVELTQNQDILEEFFDNYSSIRTKALFLFHHYQPKLIPIKHIMKKYHLKKEQIAVVRDYLPISEEYLKGNLVGYLMQHCNCTMNSEHYACIKELKRVTKLINHMEEGDELFCE